MNGNMSMVAATAVALLAGLISGAWIAFRAVSPKYRKAKSESTKHFRMFTLMNQWVKIKQDGKNLAEYLDKKNYKKIAIYGMNFIGERLLSELKDSDITVSYAIDKNAKNLFSYVDLITPDEKLEEVDAIVVTAIAYFDEIEEMLMDKGVKCPILSVEDLMYEL